MLTASIRGMFVISFVIDDKDVDDGFQSLSQYIRMRQKVYRVGQLNVRNN